MRVWHRTNRNRQGAKNAKTETSLILMGKRTEPLVEPRSRFLLTPIRNSGEAEYPTASPRAAQKAEVSGGLRVRYRGLRAFHFTVARMEGRGRFYCAFLFGSGLTVVPGRG